MFILPNEPHHIGPGVSLLIKNFPNNYIVTKTVLTMNDQISDENLNGQLIKIIYCLYNKNKRDSDSFGPRQMLHMPNTNVFSI